MAPFAGDPAIFRAVTEGTFLPGSRRVTIGFPDRSRVASNENWEKQSIGQTSQYSQPPDYEVDKAYGDST
jgi:hypothetical protein